MTADPQLLPINSNLLILACVAGLIFIFVLPALSSLLAVFGAVLEFVIDVIAGGPVAWCACLVVLILLGGCCGAAGLFGYAFSTCGTPEAVQLCSWFGL